MLVFRFLHFLYIVCSKLIVYILWHISTCASTLNAPNHQDATSAATENSLIGFGMRKDTKSFLVPFGLQRVLKHELQGPALSPSPEARAHKLGRAGTVLLADGAAKGSSLSVVQTRGEPGLRWSNASCSPR